MKIHICVSGAHKTSRRLIEAIKEMPDMLSPGDAIKWLSERKEAQLWLWDTLTAMRLVKFDPETTKWTSRDDVEVSVGNVAEVSSVTVSEICKEPMTYGALLRSVAEGMSVSRATAARYIKAAVQLKSIARVGGNYQATSQSSPTKNNS